MGEFVIDEYGRTEDRSNIRRDKKAKTITMNAFFPSSVSNNSYVP
jgi:hypothetical protein